MKKIFLIGAFLFSIFAIEKAYSDSYRGGYVSGYNYSGYSDYSRGYSYSPDYSRGYTYSPDYSRGTTYAPSYGSSDQGIDYTVGQECPCDEATGECVCKYVRYKPCYSTCKRCVEECIPYTKKCCRYVPQYYEVQKCRYVPEYYCETKCRQVPEYYDECCERTCKRWVCDKYCTYKPEYYWKRECRQTCPTCP